MADLIKTLKQTYADYRQEDVNRNKAREDNFAKNELLRKEAEATLQATRNEASQAALKGDMDLYTKLFEDARKIEAKISIYKAFESQTREVSVFSEEETLKKLNDLVETYNKQMKPILDDYEKAKAQLFDKLIYIAKSQNIAVKCRDLLLSRLSGKVKTKDIASIITIGVQSIRRTYFDYFADDLVRLGIPFPTEFLLALTEAKQLSYLDNVE